MAFFAYLSLTEKFIGLHITIFLFSSAITIILFVALIIDLLKKPGFIEEPLPKVYNLLSLSYLGLNGEFVSHSNKLNPVLKKVVLCLKGENCIKYDVIAYDNQGVVKINGEKVVLKKEYSFNEKLKIFYKNDTLFIEIVDQYKIILNIAKDKNFKWINIQIDVSNKGRDISNKEIPSGALSKSLNPANNDYKETNIMKVLEPYETNLYSFNNIELDIYGNIVEDEAK
ncbi:MAG: hypothetical protein AB1782_03585 [Cyanobacteriota bacterium]